MRKAYDDKWQLNITTYLTCQDSMDKYGQNGQ